MPYYAVYMVIGFFAQLVDGAAGMAYGLTCRTFLRAATGLPAGLVSALVHWAEAPVTTLSALSHWRLGNLDRSLLRSLAIPGALGGLLGAALVFRFGPWLERALSLYLAANGLLLLRQSRRGPGQGKPLPAGRRALLAVVGGFLDAVGGGGWGQIVTTRLLRTGGNVPGVIGSVNAAEALVTWTESLAFFSLAADPGPHLQTVACLVAGGLLAAPLAAWCCTKVPTRTLLAGVGLLVLVSNLYEWFF